jgi:hypothetical protein
MTRAGRIIVGATAVAGGSALAAWSAYAALTWMRYGKTQRRAVAGTLLDRFMPACEVAECHEIEVAAPAAATYAAAREMDLNRSAVVRAIFRSRELLLGGGRGPQAPGSLLDQTLSLGWGVLAEDPGREIVVGAVTQPWRANVRFSALPPEGFADFDAPGYAKIAWTLAAEPRGPGRSVFRTETRVATTDADSRRRFRLYWSIFSPGVLLIRGRGLALVKAEAERRCLERYADGSPRVAGPADSGAAALQPMEAV